MHEYCIARKTTWKNRQVKQVHVKVQHHTIHVQEGKNRCCPQGLPLLSLGIIFVLRGSLSWLVAPQDKNYPLGQQGQGLGTTRILSLPWDNKAQPSGWKKSSTLPREDKKKLVSSRKKKILKHFWAENTEKIVIWPWQEKVRLQPWQKKSEK